MNSLVRVSTSDNPPASGPNSTPWNSRWFGISVHLSAVEIEPFSRNTSGGFSDVFRGIHPTYGCLALKRLRIWSGHSKEDCVRRFTREADIWKTLDHPHVLPFLGLDERDGQIYLISPFAEHGTIIEYLERNSQADRRKFLREIALAMEFLHSKEIIHGDLKGRNVLVSPMPTAQVCDFGLARYMGSSTSADMKGMGTVRWQSPEIINGEPKSYTSDVYAFGITIAEILSGSLPLSEYSITSAVINAVVYKETRPPRKPLVSEDGSSYAAQWDVTEQCWVQEPHKRPSMKQVLSMLGAFSPSESWSSQWFGVRVSVSEVEIEGSPFNASGGFGDVFRARHPEYGVLALKRLRVGSEDDFSPHLRRFEREAETWKTLVHPHLLPCLGTARLGNYNYLISPFAEHGTVVDYLKQNPLADRQKFLREIASALAFLHSKSIIHGDLKGRNVLVSPNLSAQLCEFGLARRADSCTAISLKGAMSVQWSSPEIIEGKSKSYASDVYAFGMTVAEILSGSPPFFEDVNNIGVIKAVVFENKRPSRTPVKSADGISYHKEWEVAEQCWVREARDRPSMDEVILRLALPSPPTALAQSVPAVSEKLTQENKELPTETERTQSRAFYVSGLGLVTILLAFILYR